MICEAAIYSEVKPDSSMVVSTSQITSDFGGTKKVSLSKWKVKYFSGPNGGLDRRMKNYFASERAENLLGEHEENLRLWNHVSNYGKIIWIESHSKESIQWSFFQVSKQRAIAKDSEYK